MKSLPVGSRTQGSRASADGGAAVAPDNEVGSNGHGATVVEIESLAPLTFRDERE